MMTLGHKILISSHNILTIGHKFIYVTDIGENIMSQVQI